MNPARAAAAAGAALRRSESAGARSVERSERGTHRPHRRLPWRIGGPGGMPACVVALATVLLWGPSPAVAAECAGERRMACI